jgi:Icc-related predicted phosphoesterase
MNHKGAARMQAIIARAFPAAMIAASRKQLTILATADLHGWLPPVPRCDLLLIAGDICPPSNQPEWLDTEFRTWLRRSPAKEVVVTWGNNDSAAHAAALPDLPCVTLVDQTVTCAGLRIYGAPSTTGVIYERWMSDEDDDLLDGLRLPDRVDIVVCHVPPFGVLDSTGHGVSTGSRTLLREITRVQPDITICGHVHAARGRHTFPWGGQIYNVAALDSRRQPYDDPIARIELPSTNSSGIEC